MSERMWRTEPDKAVRKALAEGELSRGLAAARQATGETRALSSEEIKALEKNGNGAADWQRVRVRDGFRPSKVRGCWFTGEVELGRFEQEVELAGGVRLGSGVYNADLKDVVIGDNALILNVGVLAGYVIGAGALIMGCGEVVAARGTAFGCGLQLKVGPETGGREFRAYAEITVDVARRLALARSDQRMLAAYDEAIDEYIQTLADRPGVIGAGARVTSTPRVLNAFIGEGAQVDGATAVINATLLSSSDEPARVAAGALVEDSILQRGARAESLAIVQRSVLCERAHAERHGKVRYSLLGPDCAVGAGEVTSSLLGPCVTFHHQALLIAAIWPEGKGTVAYGANVGSNHTGRAPDQEIRPGEGAFFGIGVNVKFPADFSDAPYTIFASGVTTLPQRIAMPFSLIRLPAEPFAGVSPAYNEIIPAWVLSDCLYAVRRWESKNSKQSRARQRGTTTEIFRAEIVDLMLEARRRLAAASGRDMYTEREIDGIGKNVLTEASRQKAGETYTTFIRFYALLGYEKLLKRSQGRAKTDLFLNDPTWHHVTEILDHEFSQREPAALLERLIDAVEAFAKSVESSKARDDARGARIIHDYADAHPPAAEDPVVRETWAWARQLQDEARALHGQLDS